MSERKTKVRELCEKLAEFSSNNNSRIKALEKGQQVRGVLYQETHNPSRGEVGGQLDHFSLEVQEIRELYREVWGLKPDPLPQPRRQPDEV